MNDYTLRQIRGRATLLSVLHHMRENSPVPLNWFPLALQGHVTQDIMCYCSHLYDMQNIITVQRNWHKRLNRKSTGHRGKGKEGLWLYVNLIK